jgi:hypothetical protein
MSGSRRRSLGALAVATALLVTLVAVQPEPASAASKDGWDVRIAPIARRVEALRHLRFKHPVPAEFLTIPKFRKRVTADEKSTTHEDRRAAKVSEAELRSLGLVGGSFDLFQETNDFNASSVLAFYDSDTEKIVVRGTTLDAEARVTLAHELTHALQDQYYDLDRIQNHAHTSGADDAVLALIEGDATRIETEYYFELSAREQRAVDRAESGDGTGGAGGGPPASPDSASTAASAGIVGALLGAPYALGPQMVDVILAQRHRAGLAHAFRHPPRTQLQFLVPTRALDARQVGTLERPGLAHGAQRLAVHEPDDFGAVDLYFLLASRLPSATALRAADAWSNGKELISRNGDETCVDLVFAARDRAGARRMGAALDQWAAAMSPSAVTAFSDRLRVHACDPGRAAIAPPIPAESALEFAAVRSSLIDDLVHGGAPGSVAGCVGDRIVERPEFAIVVAHARDEPSKAEAKSVGVAIDALIPECFGG